MTFGRIIESLLRSRLYRHRVRIRTASGDDHVVQVRDVRYEGTRCRVIVTTPAHPRDEFAIPIQRIVAVEPPEPPPPGADRVA